MRIAFAGNPNSGKSSLFNAVTGAHARVGNWGGVTVGETTSPLAPEYTRGTDVEAVDLPGAYSMSAFSPEEGVTSTYVRHLAPDVLVNVVDATNLSRSLFFTTQLLELGIPLVVALNKSDMAARDGIDIDSTVLAEILGVPVVHTVATSRHNPSIAEVMATAVAARGTVPQAPYYPPEPVDVTEKTSVEEADRDRYGFVNDVVDAVETRSTPASDTTWQDRVDDVLTSPVVGIVIFAAVMWAVFTLSQTYVGPLIADWLVGWIETFQAWVTEQMAGSPTLLTTIITDGIIGGVGAVIGFLPLVMVMYFLLALLEESGYMARVGTVLDPIFKHVGLSGTSVIPVVISTGCAIPGIMATRTVRDERQRRATAMVTSWIPCGAKIPVIALFAGAFFNGAGWVSWISYFLGLVLIFVGALLVKAVTGSRFATSFFIIELPRYRRPSPILATVSMLERAKAFIIKAGTIILISNLVVHIMQAFNWRLELVPDGMADTSILATIASPVAVALIPLGFGTWQLAAAAVTGFIAKENVVGTLAVVYGLTSFIDTEAFEMTGGANTVATAMGLTSVSALAYLFFNLYTPPCFAAIGAMHSELRSNGWLFSALGLQLAVGYTVAFVVNQFGTWIVTGELAAGFVPGLVAIAAMAAVITTVARRIRTRTAEQQPQPDHHKLAA